ncbi:phosphotransferase family protein [Nocardioides sp. WS12]|uniref:phosphotransferase family protein n=1 Tax=Nocardioides sp. WS12 TaxID=2486272 RepID=UPI0015FC2452|nr:phosphotransferase family protein [Nocardioides sp. WS12]
MIPIQRDTDTTRVALSGWLRGVLGDGEVVVSELAGFKAGQSGELLTFTAHWGDGTARRQDMVVRIEPTAQYQLFLDTNFEEQYRVIDALHRNTDVPMPQAIGFESDRSILGDRFFVMAKSDGRTGLVDLDWMLDLGPDGRKQMWWNGLGAMAKLHRADWQTLGLEFLDQKGRGEDGIAQQLHYYRDYYRWANADGVTYPAIEKAYDWLVANKPSSVPNGIVWGDARRANQLFTDDLAVSAILDLEQVCLGPPEADLAWWLRTETVMADRLGIECPGIEETVEGYAELLGRPLENFDYYLVFAAYRIAVLLIKLYQLRDEQPDRGDPFAADRRLGEVFAKHAR